jgi:hypothetical protein
MLALLGKLPDLAKFGLGAAAGAALAFPTGLATGVWHGKSITRAEVAAEAATDALNRISDLEKNNASFRNLPAYDRCIVFMRDSKLPEDNCSPER